MKNYNWLYLSLAIFLIGCTGENEEVFNRTKIDIPQEKEEVHEDEVAVIVIPNLDTLSKRSQEFFNWYKENGPSYYGFESNCCQINAAKQWEINESGVNDFTDFLTESNFFSSSYIQGVKEDFIGDTYVTRAIKEMNGYGEADGIPPYASEGDIFFNIQEEASDEMYRSLNHKSSEIFKEDSVLIDTGITKMTWVFENGKWMLASNS